MVIRIPSDRGVCISGRRTAVERIQAGMRPCHEGIVSRAGDKCKADFNDSGNSVAPGVVSRTVPAQLYV
ncbi:hypothetical protein AOE01nite_01770 [Acetobacter oeni]|uniref:Uncharacterized protein n=1 Tax=Acetobacter oeni TaxID=304077 RepID=A0A511XG72_9PROT|nr:hypothetical protein AOE01nite_01770 [Acetobacter oeni]